MSNHPYSFTRWICVLLFTLAGLQPALALHLPKIFSNHMVLQRDVPVNIWGWADKDQNVRVEFAGQVKSTKAGPDGKWMIQLDAMGAKSEPSSLTVTAGDAKVSINDILVGEVWVCSGQSNMEWSNAASDQPKETIAAANYPLIRQFKVPHVTATTAQKDLPGDWKICSPKTANNFTAVGYHFGLELHNSLDGVPIGLINTSWGGTRIEPWTDPQTFRKFPALKGVVDHIDRSHQKYRDQMKAFLPTVDQWLAQTRAAIEKGGVIPDMPKNMPSHPLKQTQQPSAIYHAMVAPLIPYTMKGAIWYQGESNNGEGMLYHEKMKALISSWRGLWDQGDFPFLFVQLAPYRYNRPDALPGIWEAQAATLKVPNTGMAVITDIGNVSDIHPRNKREVGRRLSLWALAKTYGKKDLAFSGPLYRAANFQGNKATIHFTYGAGLKSIDNKPLTWFTAAGADKKFHEAQAEIHGNTLVVTSEKVAAIKAVRFGWHETAEPNLANGVGLPASPFRTDSW